MNSTVKIVAAFATGILAGGIFGILYAPEKGSDTRKKIKKEGKKISENLKDQINIGEKKLEKLRDEIQAVSDKLKSQLKKGLS